MKTKNFKIAVFFVLFVGTLIQGGQVFSQDDVLSKLGDTGTSVEEEMQWLKAETFVITASRVLENIKKSAASITVITDKEIRQMGARNLMDVLQTVPGMSYMYYPDGTYKIDARGLFKSAGQNILLMVNSHPLNESYLGGAMITYDTISLDNVQRIEVIRGPGSALYGANAFAGVINIITKEAKDINGVQVSAGGGSYQTQQYNLLFGKTFNDLRIAFNFKYFTTDGFEAPIEQDRQTILDQLFGTHASLAPGHAKGYDEKYEGSLILGYKGFKLDAHYINRDQDRPIGILYALSQKSTEPVEAYNLTLSYEGNIKEGLDLSGKVYRNYHYWHADFQALPPGAALMTPTGPTILPNGAIAKPSNKNTRNGLELLATYKSSDLNTMLAGITYEKMEQYDVEYAANFLNTPVQNVIIPLPAVQNLTDTQNYNKNVSRTFTAPFLEDLWDIKDNLRLTVGARYDHYSDFGGSFNPRAGIAWEFTKGYDLKLLYGRAFRAPSFYELYSQNNPAFVGNPDLKPETVNTYEISVGAELTEALSTRITGFRNSIKDSVDVVTSGGARIFQNKDKIRSQGIETEVKYDFGKGTYLAANYTYQDAENVDTKERLWSAPLHKGNIIANFRLSKYFNFYTNLYLQGGYEREAGDTRENNEGFAVVNTTLIAKDFIEGFEIRGSVYNLFDEDYTFPTPIDTLPVDFPMPGRNFMVEVRYELLL
jgi:outer membrane receptor for ferrienterochelin and colicins